MILLRFLYIQFYQVFTKSIIVGFKFISRFTIVDLQLLAILVFFHLIFRYTKKHLHNIKRTIFY